MGKGAKIGIGVAVLLAIVGVVFLGIYWGTYNSLVQKRNAVTKAWGDVEVAYQRRLNTIPNFVEVARFSVDFQLKLATEYAKCREGITEAAKSGEPEKLQEAANKGLAALQIAVRHEAVPEAKVDQLDQLNAEIESIERVIGHERTAFNDAVRNYNNGIQTIPGIWWAQKWGHSPMKSFEAEEGAEKAPKVELNL